MADSMHDELRDLIKSGRHSQKEVAEKLHVVPSVVSDWLQGNAHCPLPHLARIVDEMIDGDRTRKVDILLRLNLLRTAAETTDPTDARWTPSARELVRDALAKGAQLVKQSGAKVVRTTGRTLQDFPDSFYPLVVISGDKRETSEARINIGDFGASSASPAESRWLLKLGLRDVEFYGDKIFVIEGAADLKKRFGKTNLLVIGSPGSNHLARRCLLSEPKPGWRRAVPIFRFNLSRHVIEEIEKLLDGLAPLNAKQLVGKAGDPQTAKEMSFWLRALFSLGIIDPTEVPLWLRAVFIPAARDFGLISLARNPFADPDDPYVCILAAGFHMFGTAHAVRMLSEHDRFKSHPFGGVIRVDMNLERPFAKRFDESTADWDPDSDYDKQKVINGLQLLLEHMRDKRAGTVHIEPEEIEDCLQFVKTL
jgi:hypothetical protein